MTLPRFARWLATSAAILALTAPQASAFGVGLQPTTVEIELQAGQARRQVITIANVSTERPIALTLGLADWSLTEAGQIALAPPGEMEDSATGWVRFSPAFVDLKPGESAQVVVDMQAPARLPASGDHRFALLASTLLPEDRGGTSGVWRKYQLASLFYLTVGDATSQPVITGAALDASETGGARVNLAVENSGNAHARLGGVAEARSASGDVIATAEVNNLVVLDGARRVYPIEFTEALPPDALIEVRLENTFAPDVEGRTRVLEPWRAPVGALAAPVASDAR
jgi:P pilus assembly chaperone PapD